MKKDTTLLIRINSGIKNDIQEIANRYDVSVSEIINVLLSDIVKKGDLGINVKAKLNIRNIPKDGYGYIDIFQIKMALEEAIEELNLKGQINKVYLYGSFARNEQNKNSNIDLRFETTNNISMFDIGNIRYFIKEKTGRDIDISNEDVDKLDPLFYENVKKDEICIYEHQGSATSALHQGSS